MSNDGVRETDQETEAQADYPARTGRELDAADDKTDRKPAGERAQSAVVLSGKYIGNIKRMSINPNTTPQIRPRTTLDIQTTSSAGYPALSRRLRRLCQRSSRRVSGGKIPLPFHP